MGRKHMDKTMKLLKYILLLLPFWSFAQSGTTHTGKVNINNGTTTPTERLYVNGTSRFIGAIQMNAYTNGVLTVNGSGVVGVSAGGSVPAAGASGTVLTSNGSTYSWNLLTNTNIAAGAAITQSKIANLSDSLNARLRLSGGTMTGNLTLRYSVRVGGTSLFGYNTFLGKNALIAYTSGSNNTAIGDAALSVLTTANYNTAVGVSALKNTNATSNTAVGASALESNTSGGYNVAMGMNSLISTTTGQGNVATGWNALGSNVSGSVNTAVGYGAGRYNLGSNNTYLGSFSGLGFENRSGRIWISDGQSNVRIMSDSLGNVGVGTNSPTVRLQVAGDFTVSGAINTTLSNGYGKITSGVLGSVSSIPVSDITGTLPVNKGGTGAVTLTGYLRGNGTGAFSAVNSIDYSDVTFPATQIPFGSAGGFLANSAAFTFDSGLMSVGAVNASSYVTVGGGIRTGALSYIRGQANLYGGTIYADSTGAGYNHRYRTRIINVGGVGTYSIDYSLNGGIFTSGIFNIRGSNVGIGTDNPSTKLQVVGDVNISTTLVVGGRSTLNGIDIWRNGASTNNNNIAIGANTFTALTTGLRNVALGDSSLRLNTTGAQNTAIGYRAMENNTTGGFNVAIGGNSGRSANDGLSNNTYINFNGAGVTTGNNVFIGDGSAVRIRANSTGDVGINTGTNTLLATGGGLDIASGLLAEVGGANTNSSSGLRTDATSKVFRKGAVHYTNAEEPVGIVMVSSTATSGILNWGGGSTAMNAPTQQRFYTAANNTTVTGTERMRIDSLGQVGLPTTVMGRTISVNKLITGATVSYGISNAGVTQSDVTSASIYYATNASTAAASYTVPSLYHYYAIQGTVGAGSTVTNQYGFYVDAGATGATNNYGLRSDLAASTGRWNVFTGTAQSYFGGKIGVGSGKTVPVYDVDVNGVVGANRFVSQGSAPTISAGAGAGTIPAIALAAGSTDNWFQVQLVTGTSPSVSSVVATITFSGGAYSTASFGGCSPVNSAAATLSGANQVFFTNTTTTLVINSNTTALASGTDYRWNCWAGGK